MVTGMVATTVCFPIMQLSYGTKISVRIIDVCSKTAICMFGFTSCKGEQSLQGMELQEKQAQKD